MEGALALQRGGTWPHPLSEQQLISCVSDNNCAGGLMTHAYEYGMKTGLIPSAAYPYQEVEGRCRDAELADKAVARLVGFEALPAGDADALQKALLEQPVAVGVNAGSYAFMFYKEGVISMEECAGEAGAEANHAVVLVGMGTDARGGRYLTLRNSWGAGWGDKGHVRIALGACAMDHPYNVVPLVKAL